MENSLAISHKTEHILTYDPEIPLLDIQPREMKASTKKPQNINTYHGMSTSYRHDTGEGSQIQKRNWFCIFEILGQM